MVGGGGGPHHRSMNHTTTSTPPPSPAPPPPPASPPPATPSGRRTGATWVAGTGAFLLLAAAATFIAVRWDTLPESAKLALVGALTGGFLLGGRALSRTLPATGDVLFHLGAFLLPVDVAGLAVRGGWDWRWLLLAEGVVGVVALGWLGRARRTPPSPGSVVLRVAAAAAMPVLAAGVAGLTPLPAGVVLIALALAADGLGRLAIAGAVPVAPSEGTGWRRAASAWAALAGLAPLIGLVLVAVTGPAGPWAGPSEFAARLGAGTLTDLGLLGRPVTLTAGVTGLMAAWVLGRRARERTDAALAFLALACVATGALATVITPGLTAGSGLVAAAAAFLGVEVAAWLAGRDPFWRPVLGSVAGMAEAVGSVPTILGASGLVVLAAVLGLIGQLDSWSGPAAVALALAAAGWLAADLRHAPVRGSGTGESWALIRTLVRGGGREGAFLLAALSAVAAVVAATSSSAAGAVALVVVAAAAVAAARLVAPLVAATAVPWALVVAFPEPGWCLGVGLAGAAVLVEASRLGSRHQDLHRLVGHLGVFELLATASVPVALAGAGVGVGLIGPGAAAVVGVAACWLLAVRLDAAGGAVRTATFGSLADVARLGMLVPLVVLAARGLLAPTGTAFAIHGPFRPGAAPLAAAETIPAAVAALGLFAFDAARRRRPVLALGSAAAVQLLLAEVARAAGLDPAGVGLTLAAGAIAWSGLAAVVEDPWRTPFLAAAGAGLGLGAVAAAGDPAAFSTVLLITGGLLIAAGLVSGRVLTGHAGGVLIALGIGGHLVTAGVGAPEPYVLPVAAQLVVAGAQARRRRASGPSPISSWVAYGPAIALLGGVALAERLGGGSGWHALVVGAVGVAAVATGGMWRLAGPLVLGTGLLVAVTAHESLTALAGVPTWAWLAAGGGFLLATGVALERSDTSPVEAGRRVVDILSERFA